MAECSPGSFARSSWPPPGRMGCAARQSGCRSPVRWCTASCPARPLPRRGFRCAAAYSGRLVTIDYLGEDVTSRGRRSDGARPTWSCSMRWANAASPRTKVRPLEVSLKLSALGQALPRDGEKIALENAHTICERAQRHRGVGDGGRRGPHHHRLDAVDRARIAHRVRLARNGFAGLPEAHARPTAKSSPRLVPGSGCARAPMTNRRRWPTGTWTTSPTPTCAACAC